MLLLYCQYQCIAFVAKREEQQQHEEEVQQEEDEDEKQPQSKPAEFNARIKDSIATNIKVNEVVVTWCHHMQALLVSTDCTALPALGFACMPDNKTQGNVFRPCLAWAAATPDVCSLHTQDCVALLLFACFYVLSHPCRSGSH